MGDFGVSTFFQIIDRMDNYDILYSLKVISVTLFTIYAWYILFWRPLDLRRSMKDLKWDKNERKRQMINDVMKKRKIGNLPPSYPNGWFAIMESSQLKCNERAPVNVLGLNLAVWRGASGLVYATDAMCPHLGANLGDGLVKGECIECPFHKWRFEGTTGKVTMIPYSESIPSFAQIKVRTTVEMNGFIFLWYHVDDEPPCWFLTPVPQVSTKEWKYRGRSEFQVACHIQEIPENGADVAHFNALHGSPILTGSDFSDSLFKLTFFRHVWSASWMKNPDPDRSFEALLKVQHYLCFFNKFNLFHVNVDVKQIGPGIVFLYFDTVFGKGLLIQTVTPVEPLLQKVTHIFYSSNSLIHPLGLLILSVEAAQFERDVHIWNKKTYVHDPVLTKEDAGIKRFRRWYSQFYSTTKKTNYFSKDDQINLDF